MTTRRTIAVLALGMALGACGAGDDSGSDTVAGADNDIACYAPATSQALASCIALANASGAVADSEANVCLQVGGMIQDSMKCPTANLLGCCHRAPTPGTHTTETDCSYMDNTSSAAELESQCEASSAGATWSTTP